MKTVTSISGGKSSAYLAAHYPSDYNVFSLVRIEDQKCLFPDPKIRKEVEDRIQAPFIATAEDDMIIYTILDLEQYLGRKIDWVTGITFDEVLRTKGGWLPNAVHRYCTYNLKIAPIFEWWQNNFSEPVEMQIGYRANETGRIATMEERLNPNGLLEYYSVIGRTKSGRRNRWASIPWQKPSFPMAEDQVFRIDVERYWEGKPVRFAPYNNCVGCYHREPMFLRFMFQVQPKKMGWFKNQEVGRRRGTWRFDMRYEQIEKLMPQSTFFPESFSSCPGGCGI